jgi:chemotaxis protein methyltransferase CheR
MPDSACVHFLQWALPQLRLRWRGYRRVRRQVCKRLGRRLRALGLPDLAAYRDYLATHPAEWSILDDLCHISISRFYRDRAVFDQLTHVVWPILAEQALARGQTAFRCWSIGCASGEEPYTLSLIWHLVLQPRFPTLSCHILATDAAAGLLERAKAARYPASSLRELPQPWREAAFSQVGDEYRLGDRFHAGVEFQRQDIRAAQPSGPFHLVLCRNLVLTYFAESLQREVLAQVIPRLDDSGVFVAGTHETLPEDMAGLAPWFPNLGIYRKEDEKGVKI